MVVTRFLTTFEPLISRKTFSTETGAVSRSWLKQDQGFNSVRTYR